MRIPIAIDHFFAGQGALSVVYLLYTNESARRPCGKMAMALRVGPQIRLCGVAHRSFRTTKHRSMRASPEAQCLPRGRAEDTATGLPNPLPLGGHTGRAAGTAETAGGSGHACRPAGQVSGTASARHHSLGPVHTMRIPIAIGHFLAGQGALSVVYLLYMSESATRPCGKMAMALRVGPQIRPCGVAHRSFRTTKHRSARLAWPDLRANAGHSHSVKRP